MVCDLAAVCDQRRPELRCLRLSVRAVEQCLEAHSAHAQPTARPGSGVTGIYSSVPGFATNPLFTGTLTGYLATLDGLFSIGLRATPGSVANFPSIDAQGTLLICDTQPIPNCHTEQTDFVEGQISQITPAPEPGTLALIAIAVAGIAGARRECRRRTQRRA